MAFLQEHTLRYTYVYIYIEAHPSCQHTSSCWRIENHTHAWRLCIHAESQRGSHGDFGSRLHHFAFCQSGIFLIRPRCEPDLFLLMCTAACRRVRVCVPEEGAFLAVSVSQWGTCWLKGKLRVLRRLSSVRAGERCQPASRWENQSCCLRLFTLLLLMMIIYSGRNIRPSISDFTSDYYNRRWDDYYDLAVAFWLLTILVTVYFIEGIDFWLRIPLYDNQKVPKVDAARFSVWKCLHWAGFDR